MTNVMDNSDEKREGWFNFLWNRTRAIRKVKSGYELVSKALGKLGNIVPEQCLRGWANRSRQTGRVATVNSLTLNCESLDSFKRCLK